ncbi:PQQ-binding-like beta-propeller repeat protein [Bacteroidota bacterium]
MKRILVVLLFSVSLVHSQSYKFAWISDLHIGYPEADMELDSVVQLVNNMSELKFLIASGDIAEKGRNDELERTKEILDRLEITYYIIPGNHDTKWSESGCTKFIEQWNNDKFIFKYDKDIFIGLNSGIPWRGGGGHIKPEDIQWLKQQLSSTDTTDNIYFVVHHPLDESIDNWYVITNVLRNYNIKAVLYGHGHENKITDFNNIPAVMCRSTLSKNKNSWGFTVVQKDSNSLTFYEAEKDTVYQPWGKINFDQNIEIQLIDSTEFINYDAEVNWINKLDATVSAEPLIYNNKIFTASINGIVTCFDSSGSMIWDFDTFGNIYSKPAAMDNWLVVGTIQGDLYTLDSETGYQVNAMGFDDAITSQLVTFDYENEVNFMAPKETNSKAAVIIGTSKGNVYCYDLETLQEIWISNDPGGMIETKPLIINNRIIFGCWDSYLYCLDAREGWLIWRWSEVNNFYYSPAACKPISDGKTVYITTPQKYVYAVDLNLGATKWKKNDFQAWESIGISDDYKKLFIKSFKDKFYIVSTKKKKRIREINIKFGIDTMPCQPIEWNSNILFGSKNGHVYKIDKKYKYLKLLFLGPSRVHTIQHFNNNNFVASNMDGTITMFSIK